MLETFSLPYLSKQFFLPLTCEDFIKTTHFFAFLEPCTLSYSPFLSRYKLDKVYICMRLATFAIKFTSLLFKKKFYVDWKVFSTVHAMLDNNIKITLLIGRLLSNQEGTYQILPIDTVLFFYFTLNTAGFPHIHRPDCAPISKCSIAIPKSITSIARLFSTCAYTLSSL